MKEVSVNSAHLWRLFRPVARTDLWQNSLAVSPNLAAFCYFENGDEDDDYGDLSAVFAMDAKSGKMLPGRVGYLDKYPLSLQYDAT